MVTQEVIILELTVVLNSTIKVAEHSFLVPMRYSSLFSIH